MTLTSSLNPSTCGEAVTFTATVTVASGPVPTGTVNFKPGGLLEAWRSAREWRPLPPPPCVGAVRWLSPPSMPAISERREAQRLRIRPFWWFHRYHGDSQKPSAMNQSVTFTATVTAASGPVPT